MPLRIHDTYTREKRVFEPVDPKRVRLYVCGPTVYNYAHIGNARPVVVFDVLFRLLRRLYGDEHVVYARNVTDVDDKINAAAMEMGVPISAITDKYAAIFEQDMSALGALKPTLEPRATAYIGDMLHMIERLMRANAAYAAEGHVLFDTQVFSDYGKLSGRSLEDMIAGARVEVAPYKQNPADFVLWKPSKPGEPVWESPWGPGRPGWHLECSAMIEANLAPLPIDIHGGGHDLIFPHHENEIAQSRCADHAPALANYWMHNGFLTIEAEKMSKSIGNVLLVHELLEKVPGEVIRWALLSTHYRAPLDWTGELLVQARRSLDRLYGVLQRAKHVPYTPGSTKTEELEPLLDDLNTPSAMTHLFARATSLDQAVREGLDAQGIKNHLMDLAQVMGVLQSDPDAWFEGGADEDLKSRIEALVGKRGEARKAKDWPAADRIRAELADLGVEVLDGPDGTASWRMREGA